MKSLVDSIGFLLIKNFSDFVRDLPLERALLIGRFLGRAAMLFSNRRRVAYSDMKAALGAGFSEVKIKRLVRDHYEHMGQMFIETLRFPVLDKETIERTIHIHNIDRFYSAIARDKGLILLTGHFGNWELLQIVSGILGKPIHVLARGHKHSRLNDFLNSLRESHGSMAIRRGMGIRDMLRGLRRKELVGLVADQDAGKQGGVIIPFLGRKTTVPTGAFDLALRTGAPVLPCFIVRRGDIHHDIYVGEPIEISKMNQEQQDLELAARSFMGNLEKFIRKHPEQYLWETKRWKYSWSKRILILSDGKPGHVKQSQAVAGQIHQIDSQYGRPGMEYLTQSIEVKFKSGFHRALFGIISLFLLPWAQGRLWTLHFFLKPECAQKIAESSTDFVISAGSSLVPINLMIAKDSRAKSIVLMKPSFPFNFFRYDLAVVPAHDEGLMPDKAFRTILTPSLVEENSLEEDAEKLKGRMRNIKRVKFAVFLGGPTRRFQMDLEDVKSIVASLKNLSPAAGDFVITTSRRTPDKISKYLKEIVAQDPACQMVVIAKEDSRPEVVGGMMALADVLIVTEDSVSMISEAVNSGKKVVVLELGSAALPKKHRRFKEILARESAIRTAGLNDFQEKTLAALNDSSAGQSRLHRETIALRTRLQEIL